MNPSDNDAQRREAMRELRRSRTFSAMSDAALLRLSGSCRVKHVSSGALVARAGTPLRELVFVSRGRLILTCEHKNREATALLGIAEAPSLLGDAEHLMNVPWTATARADEDCTVVLLSGSAFGACLDADHGLARALYRDALGRLLIANHTVSTLAVRDLEVGLLRVLVDSAGNQATPRLTVNRTHSVSELAQALAVSRRSISRALAKLEGQGLVERAGPGRFVIHNSAALQERLPPELLGLSFRADERPTPLLARLLGETNSVK